MKIDLPDMQVIRGKPSQFEEKSFGIGNLAVILEILRSKMYGDPVKVICQEISSNARDANRELARILGDPSKANIPIEITLPNKLNNLTCVIKDNGPGIDPDRMENVFIWYGVSTKRDTDEETGCWGLGAKTPWADGDAFGVITITPEAHFEEKGIAYENCMVRRQYVCYIDETREGRLSLHSESVTDDPQGTAILIACKEGEEHLFEGGVINACQHWTNRPIIRGKPEFKWPSNEKRFEGEDKDWFILEDGQGGSAIALIDEIPYKIDKYNLHMSYVDDEEREKVYAILNKPVFLKFKTGEVISTATRESIDYAKKDLGQIIKDRAVKVFDELQEMVNIAVSKANNLWDAKLSFSENSGYFMLQTAEWNGIPIDGDDFSFNSYGVTMWKYDRRHGEKFRRQSERSHGARMIRVRNGHMMVIDDNIDGQVYPSRQRIQTIFDSDENIQTLYLMRMPFLPKRESFNGQENADVRFLKATDLVKGKLQQLETKGYFSKYNVVKLSNFEKAPIVREHNSSGERVAPVVTRSYRFDGTKNWYRNKDIDLSEEEGCVVLLDNRHPVMQFESKYDQQKYYWLSNLKDVLELAAPNMKVWGVPKRFESSLKKTNLVRVEALILMKMQEIEDDPNFIKIHCDDARRDLADRQLGSFLIDALKSLAFTDNLDNSDSLSSLYVKFSETMDIKINDISRVLKQAITMRMDISDGDKYEKVILLQKLRQKFIEAYPMLHALSQSYHTRGRLSPENLVEYVNMRDEKLAKTSKPKEPQNV